MNPRLFEIFARLLTIHINTKTTCPTFHKDTQPAYELAFDAEHQIREMRQDIEEDAPEEMEDVAGEAYGLVEEMKTILKSEISKNSDPGMDNLLRTLYERTNGVCGTLRAYANEAEEENNEEMDEDAEDASTQQKGIKGKGMMNKY